MATELACPGDTVIEDREMVGEDRFETIGPEAADDGGDDDADPEPA